MPISLSCSQCGRRLKAPDNLAGRQAKCQCGAVVDVPEPEPQELLIESPAPAKPKAPPAHESAVQAKLSELADAFDVIRPSLWPAVRIMIIAVAIAAPLQLGGMYLLRNTMDTIGGPMEPADYSGFATIAPAIIAGLAGACFGFLSGRAMTEQSGLLGWPACVVGTAGVLLLMGLCLGAGVLLFPAGIPTMFNCALFSMGFMAMIGISFYTLWVA